MAKKAPAKKKTSTALARRRSYPGQTLLDAVKIVKGVQVLPPESVIKAGQLTEHMELGALGLVEVKLTEKEEAILARNVNPGDIRVKPDGIAYLSHPTYTRWFNEAFGRLGWTMVPVAKPSINGGTVTCPYVLYIHGKPAAFAVGEQDYSASNSRQSYGDAFEATVASGLRRCAKRLGVGLELWDKPYMAEYLAEECVLVQVQGKNGVERQWRRKADRPFYNEIVRGSQPPRSEDRPADDPNPRPKAQSTAQGAPAAPQRGAGVPISEGQVKRFFAILRNSGRNEELVRDWLTARYGFKHVNEITRDHYDAVCTAVEAEGKLP